MKTRTAFLKTISTTLLCLLLAIGYAQKKETVTIKGKITVEGTNKPPIGIISLIEVGVADYLIKGSQVGQEKDVIGTNRHTFVEKDGSYSFTVQKNATVYLRDYGNRYIPWNLEKINVGQTRNIALKEIKSKEYEMYRKNAPLDKLNKIEKKVDIHKKVKVSGTLVDVDNKPIDNATIMQLVLLNQAGQPAFTLSDKKGKFEYKIQKGSPILIASPDLESKQFTISSDTILNIQLLRANPFKK